MEIIPLKKTSQYSEHIPVKHLLTFIVGGTAIGMFFYEWGKELFFPALTKWESHFITIMVTVLIVSVLTWFILQKQNRLMAKIDEQTIKAETASKHLASIVESSKDAIFSINSEGNIISWNSGANQIFGISEDEIVNKPFQILIPPEIPYRIQDLLNQTDTEKRIQHFEGLFMKKDGSRIHLSCIITPLPDLPGYSGSISIIARDISVHIAREEMLKMLSVKLQLLSSITRHDINNNLQVLMGSCSILLDEVTDPKIRKIVSVVEDQSKVISSQIQFMKEYESLGVKTPVWHKAEEVFTRVMSQFTKDQSFYKISLSSLEIYADPLIDKVIYNLCDNAFRYGGTLTYIRSFYELRGDKCYWIVEDDGVGVQPEVKEKIFEKGFGLTSGLGLFYIREILSITNIQIQETGTPENGARFEMVIPAGFWRLIQ